MIAYIKSGVDFTTKDIMQFETFSTAEDIDFAEKSSIVVDRKPNLLNDDFLIIKDGSRTVFFGICETVDCDEAGAYTVTLRQKENLFDRQIFVGTDSLIASAGIEDFIKSEIEANWVDSGDPVTDRTFYDVTCLTHTKINASANVFGGVENGIYNLKTFIGNCLEHYMVHMSFTFSGENLGINIYVDESDDVPIDVTVSDITDYDETYAVDALAKLIVRWKNTQTEAVSSAAYYLKKDRTITTDPEDPDRAEGKTRSVYFEAESADEMYEMAVNEFSNNSYQHQINFSLYGGSLVYDTENYYVGRKAIINTITGVQRSIVTKRTETSESTYVGLSFGKLKVTLIEKLRRAGK